MDTTIRNLDETAYRELKAKAALEGKTIGELVSEAIRAFLARPLAHSKTGSLKDWQPERYPKGNEWLSREVREATSIDLPDDLRARLVQVAAERGEKQFSTLIVEAVEFYLKHRAEEERRIAEALSALGSLNDGEAERLRDSVRRLRETWR